MMIPSNEYNYFPAMVFFAGFLFFVFFYTDSGASIIFLSITQVIWNFMLVQWIYEDEVTVFDIFEKLSLTILLFLICSMLAVLVLYISSLQMRMKSFNMENIKLLDGMHEGLLILTKSDKKIMFCNKPS